jgi:hypothetical protein
MLRINAIAESTPHLALIRNNASISNMIASLPERRQDQKLLCDPQGCCFLCQLIIQVDRHLNTKGSKRGSCGGLCGDIRLLDTLKAR